jgi:RimJ/RimL family protein N-acetyltransferase
MQMSKAEQDNLFVGDLVRLVAPTEADAPILARWTEDSDYLRAMDTDYIRPLSAEQITQSLNPEQPDPNSIVFHMRTLDRDRLIGFVALHSIEWNNGTGMLSIGIGDLNYRSKGYGSDALRLVLRYAFHELNLYRLGLDVTEINTRAIGAYQKVGFQQEGIVRGAVLRDGRRHDLILMGLLREEWERHHAGAPA